MSDNPYQSPQSDLTPPDLRHRREKLVAWLKDRALLWLTGFGVFVFLMVISLTLPNINNSVAKAVLAVLAIIAWWTLQSRVLQRKTPSQ
ncbi:MAG: hypothetical protein SGJ19_08765 [Planctomycetia bacterium]|nr:hypothetical protein [Planctomycetia bacterium]